MRRAIQRKFHFIYKTTCTETKMYYIGMHSTDDMNDGYLGSGKALWLSIKKYGKENHTLEILEQLDSRSALSKREEELVDDTLLKDDLCMNLQRGGYPDRRMTEKLRKFISERTREGMNKSSVKEKMSIPGLRVVPWNKGKSMPEGTGEKISKSKLGHKTGPFSEKRKKAISDAIKNHWLKRKVTSNA